jgi:hypothetical protein
MNYSKIYDEIINNAKSTNRIKSKNLYFENHHIIPKSIYGTNDKINLVLLTAKEHFVCHHLLTKIYDNAKLKFAFWSMCNQLSGDVNRKYIVTSITYSNAKQQFAKVNSERHKGKKIPKFMIDMFREQFTLNNPHKPGKDSHLFGTNRTEEIKSKISITKLNFPERNASFKGYYITPFGKFASSGQASKIIGLKGDNIRSRCSKSSTIITKNHVLYNSDLIPSHIGKSFKELGWDFLPIQS